MATPHKTELSAVARVVEKPAEERLNPIADWTVVLLMWLFGMTTLCQAFVVPTGSMTSTLLVGDHLIVDKLAYAPSGRVTGKLLPYTDVKRGDIIVFRWPVDLRETYVKRVIGVPGDHIRFENKQLILNGRRAVEPYVIRQDGQRSNYLNNFPQRPEFPIDQRAFGMLATVENGEIVVPAGQYFAMGDNRDNSADSRFWGFVPRENIVGKPLIIFWSYDAPTEHLADGNINLDHIADLAQNFFVKTRWRRTFKLVRGYDLRVQ